MKVCEFVGIIVLQCEKCGKKFVVNSEAVKQGFQAGCKCSIGGIWFGRGSTATISIKPNPHTQWDGKNKLNVCNAMPIAEYKKLLADFIINGRKPKIPKEHSKVVSIHTDETQYQNLYETLRQLGYSKDEAFAKIDVALKEGLRMETEIIKYILSLQ